MEYIYAAMLLHKAGQKVTEESVKKVLDAASVKTDASRVKALIAALEGVDIDKAIEKSAVVSAAAAPAETSGGEQKAEGEKKEEKSPEEEKKSEEQAAAGLGALFG